MAPVGSVRLVFVLPQSEVMPVHAILSTISSGASRCVISTVALCTVARVGRGTVRRRSPGRRAKLQAGEQQAVHAVTDRAEWG
jgi:hypothetical protein